MSFPLQTDGLIGAFFNDLLLQVVFLLSLLAGCCKKKAANKGNAALGTGNPGNRRPTVPFAQEALPLPEVRHSQRQSPLVFAPTSTAPPKKPTPNVPEKKDLKPAVKSTKKEEGKTNSSLLDVPTTSATPSLKKRKEEAGVVKRHGKRKGEEEAQKNVEEEDKKAEDEAKEKSKQEAEQTGSKAQKSGEQESNSNMKSGFDSDFDSHKSETMKPKARKAANEPASVNGLPSPAAESSKKNKKKKKKKVQDLPSPAVESSKKVKKKGKEIPKEAEIPKKLAKKAEKSPTSFKDDLGPSDNFPE